MVRRNDDWLALICQFLVVDDGRREWKSRLAKCYQIFPSKNEFVSFNKVARAFNFDQFDGLDDGIYVMKPTYVLYYT